MNEEPTMGLSSDEDGPLIQRGVDMYHPNPSATQTSGVYGGGLCGGGSEVGELQKRYARL